MIDAFWEVRLHGFLAGFEENAASRGGETTFGEGVVTPVGVVVDYDGVAGYLTGRDLGRDLQQLVVLWAGWKIVMARLGSLNSTFRAKAGPVEYETQQAATVLKAILDSLKAKIDFVLQHISIYGRGADVVVFDSLVERSYAQAQGYQWWIR